MLRDPRLTDTGRRPAGRERMADHWGAKSATRIPETAFAKPPLAAAAAGAVLGSSRLRGAT